MRLPTIFGEQPTIFGAQLSVVILVFLAAMIRAMTLSSLLGYLPTLLQRFGIQESNVGYYQALINAQYFTVQLVLLIVTGSIGDVYTRFKMKHIFLVSNSIQGIAFLLLALSQNTVYLFCAVFVIALPVTVGPNLDCIVFKYTNTDQRVSAVTYLISMPYTLGFFFGPAISGGLSFPLQQYPNLFPDSLFLRKYLVFIPNMLLFLLQVFTLILACFVLSSDEDEPRNTEIRTVIATEQTIPSILRSMVRYRNFAIIYIAQITNAMGWQGFNNAFSLYSQTSYSKGGLGLTPEVQGQIYFAAGFVVLFADLFIISKSISVMGSKNGLHFWTTFIMFFASIVVSFRAVRHYSTFCYVFNVAMVAVGVAGTRVSIYDTIFNVVPTDILGQCLAIRMIFASIGDIIGHYITGNLFAWSLSNEANFSEDSKGFPYNHPFVFYVISFILLLSLLCETQLSKA